MNQTLPRQDGAIASAEIADLRRVGINRKVQRDQEARAISVHWRVWPQWPGRDD